MGLFKRQEEAPTATASRTSPSPPVPSRQLASGNWADDDPRQLSHQLLSSVGMAQIWWSSGTVEDLWQTLVGRAPALTGLESRAKGFACFLVDQETIVYGVDSPQGSALVVAVLPESDTGHLVQEVTMRLRGVEERGITMSILTQGLVEEPVAEILETGAIVQLTELPLRELDPQSAFSVLPPWIRRQLGAWEEVAHDLYRREFTDSDGDVMKVWCSLESDTPAIVYPFLDNVPGGDLTRFEPLLHHIDGKLIWLDPQVAAVHALRESEHVDVAAQSLVDGIAHGLAVSSPTRTQPGAPPVASQTSGHQTATTLGSWDEVMTYLRDNWTIAEEFKAANGSSISGCKMIFKIDETRSQMVFVDRHDLGDSPWLSIYSPFAEYRAVDISAVLHAAGRLICGNVRLFGDHLALHHSTAIQSLAPGCLENLVHLIFTSADRLEQEFDTGDRY